MKRADLPAIKRTEKGKNVARRLRRDGKIPAVLYGKGSEPMPLTIALSDFKNVLHGQESHNTLISMKVEGEGSKELLSLPKEIVFDPLCGDILHIDFQQVHLDQAIATQIPVHVVGSSPGVKQGGVLEHLIREIDIECLPMDIPEFIEADISSLQIGDSIHVADLNLEENVRILSDESSTVVIVAAPTLDRSAEEAEEEAAEEGAEETAEEAPAE